MPVTLKVLKLEPIGNAETSKVSWLTYEQNGQAVQQKVRAWKSANLEVGKEYTGDWEDKENTYNGETTTQRFFVLPKAPRGGGGGGYGPKTDPEANAIARERLFDEKAALIFRAIVGKPDPSAGVAATVNDAVYLLRSIEKQLKATEGK